MIGQHRALKVHFVVERFDGGFCRKARLILKDSYPSAYLGVFLVHCTALVDGGAVDDLRLQFGGWSALVRRERCYEMTMAVLRPSGCSAGASTGARSGRIAGLQGLPAKSVGALATAGDSGLRFVEPGCVRIGLRGEKGRRRARFLLSAVCSRLPLKENAEGRGTGGPRLCPWPRSTACYSLIRSN